MTRLLKWSLPAVLVPGLLLAATLAYLVESESGSTLLWRLATRSLTGTLSGTYVSGTLADGLHIRGLKYTDQKTVLDIDDVDGRWQLTRNPLKLSISSLRAGKVEVRLSNAPSAKTGLPQDLSLPLALDVKQLTVGELDIHQGLSSTILRDLAAHGTSDRIHHRVTLEHVATPYGMAAAELHVLGNKPFALGGTASMAGSVQQEHYTLDAKVDGTLQALAIKLHAGGDKLGGDILIHATPFAPVPFEQLELNVAHLNPKMFNASAPSADLNLHAELTPEKSAQASAPFPALNGTVTVSNAKPGALDVDKLPLQSASATLHLDGRHQQLTQLHIQLSGKGTLDGHGDLQQAEGGPAAASGASSGESIDESSGEFRFDVKALDLHALHGKLSSTQFAGPLLLKLQPATQQVTLKLADPQFAVALDGQADAGRITLRSAQLSAGNARLNVSGSLTRDTEPAYVVQGKLSQFDPALWLSGSRAQAASRYAIHGNINMDFSAEGRIAQQLQTAVKFDVHDSEYGKLPMAGRGYVALSGKHLLPSEVKLSVAGNDVAFTGGFGTPADRLKIKIDAPQLERLGFGLTGAVKLDGEISGSIERQDLQASYSAQHLSFGAYRVASLNGKADIHGDLRDTSHALSSDRLSASIDLRDYASPGLTLEQAQATLSGSYGKHEGNVSAKGMVHGKPLALDLAAQGGLTQTTEGPRWDGTVGKLESRGVPHIVAAAPFMLSVAPQRLVVGAAQFAVLDSTLDLKSLRFDHGALASEGSTGTLELSKILALQQEFTGVAAALKSDLRLTARWKFATDKESDGFLDIDRQGGDFAIDPGHGDVALGLSDLHLHAALHARRLTVEAQAAASRIGTLKVQAQSTLKAVETAQDSPGLDTGQAFSAKIDLDVPHLKTVGALLGPRYAIGGSIAASLTGAGTLAQPKWSGMVAGDKLALTLFDQGIQLHDGTARLALNENVITLQQLEFHGGDGTLKADGQVQVGQTNPDLRAHFVADHLQLFASPDRQLILSGQAGLSSVHEQLHIDGKLAVDRALFDFPKSSTPQLGDDVLIVHRGGKAEAAPVVGGQKQLAQAGEKPAGRFAPVVDIGIALGDDFRFRGTGADLKLGGNLAVHSEPYQALRANGTVQVVSGTYEVFGRKLAIESGVLNFQGPLDNPNIDILAMRRNQEVEAGVEVTGLARRPRIKLISEPDVVDEEKLSWLMFGHGSSSNGVGQQQASTAALGLLGNVGGKPLAKGLGLDSFSIGASESGLNDQQVVNIGKAISEKFVIGYEQSLSGSDSIAKLTWQVSQRWSLVLRAGAINGFDVLFSLRFD